MKQLLLLLRQRRCRRRRSKNKSDGRSCWRRSEGDCRWPGASLRWLMQQQQQTSREMSACWSAAIRIRAGKARKRKRFSFSFFWLCRSVFFFLFLYPQDSPPPPPPPQKKKKKNKSIVLVPRVLALGALVEHRRPLVGGPQLHGVKLQPPVPALHARLVDGRADPRRRVRRAARRLIVPSVTAPVFPDRVRPQGSELVPPAVVVDVCLADDGHGVEVCFFFFF